jgi:hypothetical protein
MSPMRTAASGVDVAVVAGTAAAIGNGWFGPTAPVLTGTATALVTVAATTGPGLSRTLRTRRSPRCLR